MISLNNEPCCVCGSRVSTLVWETTYPEHAYPGSFCLRKCDTCALLFNSPRLDDTELANLYGDNYYFFSRKDRDELLRCASMIQRTISMLPEPPREKRLLDVGCGRGYLPAILRGMGWSASGVEISSGASDYARSTFGIEVFTGTIEQFANSASFRTYPVLTAIDVIEHVPDPRRFVESLAKCTEVGGHILIDTPNAASANIDVEKIEWKGFNPFHIYLFTIASLGRLVDQCGFEVVRSFSYGNTPSTGHLSLASRVRQMVRSAPFLAPIVRAGLRSRNLFARAQDTQKALAEAVSHAESAPAYSLTPDASAPLAASRTGDNIVVIARGRS
jgi:2-polyprenyl-3-methyl-5-hydroxy-6-metoxy-1,4-benzoquinol methylase